MGAHGIQHASEAEVRWGTRPEGAPVRDVDRYEEEVSHCCRAEHASAHPSSLPLELEGAVGQVWLYRNGYTAGPPLTGAVSWQRLEQVCRCSGSPMSGYLRRLTLMLLEHEDINVNLLEGR